MEREGFIFYQSFFNAGKNLPVEHRIAFYDRIVAYGIDGTDTPSGDVISESMFLLVKPQIDANNKRFLNGNEGGEHGYKGGRPRTKQEPQRNPNETPKKPLKNPKKTPKEKEKEKEKVNDNDNDNDNDKTRIVPIHSFIHEDSELRSKLQEFLIFRKEKKCPILPASQVAFSKKLEKMSGGNTQNAIDILEQSIANGWQGIFPIEEKSQPIMQKFGY